MERIGHSGTEAVERAGAVGKQHGLSAILPLWDCARDDSRKLRLLALCLASGAIGLVAWSDRESLYRLTLLSILPALIIRAPFRLGAFLIAWMYYGVAMRSVPAIIDGFFPRLIGGTSLVLWFTHAGILALPWVAAWAPPEAGSARRAIGVAIALSITSLPPLGFFHWGSPLMVAGLLFPATHWWGLLATVGVLTLLAVGDRRLGSILVILIGAILLPVLANARYQTPIAPADWHALSLSLGRSPELWSDDMAARRAELAGAALREVQQGARVVVLPESIAGSNRRAQPAIWQAVATTARAKGATVLVGEEHWQAGHSGFRNALVAYGQGGEDGEVFVFSQVPMPLGDWKFGGEDGAETDLFGDDVRRLHGRDVAFSMCYEDFLLWPHRGLLSGRATLLISATNQWPSRGTSAEVAQDLSRRLLARLAGVPLLTAKNH